jgi:hypothetical protein
MNIDLLTTYNELMTKITALRAEAKTTASTILHEGTKSYFEKYGHIVEQIFWTQYTPWFNDGETCEFSVGEPHLVLVADENEDKYEYGSAFHTDIEGYEASLAVWAEFNADPEAYKTKLEVSNPNYFNARWNPREAYRPYYPTEEELHSYIAQAKSYPEGLVADTQALFEFISSIEPEIMEELFTNHVTVRITATGIETEEYSHE